MPVCTPPCINSQCMPNNYCECDYGYTRDEYAKNKCLPYCYNCANGKCIRPNVCECNTGYRMNENNVCEPICAQNCEKQHAYCSSPNICTCNVGYKAVNRVRIASYARTYVRASARFVIEKLLFKGRDAKVGKLNELVRRISISRVQRRMNCHALRDYR